MATDGVMLGIGPGIVVDDVDGDVKTNPNLAASSSTLFPSDSDRGDIEEFDIVEDVCNPGDGICAAGLVKMLGTETIVDGADDDGTGDTVDEKNEAPGLDFGDMIGERVVGVFTEDVGILAGGVITKPNLAASATASLTGVAEVTSGGSDVRVDIGLSGNCGIAGDRGIGSIVKPSLAASSIIFLVAKSFSSVDEDVEIVRAGEGAVAAAGCIGWGVVTTAEGS